MEQTQSALPYAIMCRLKDLAGDRPSTNFIPVSQKRPSPEGLHVRKGYVRPISPRMIDAAIPDAPQSRYEHSASIQDLVDFGLVKHGYWAELGVTQYGFHLTDKAVEILLAPPTQP